MEQRGLNQLQLATQLNVSAATVSRALGRGALSARMRARAERWLRDDPSQIGAKIELHLLHKTIRLLLSLQDKVDALATDMRREGIGGGDE